jgi:uncharacterized membrane protein YfcA
VISVVVGVGGGIIFSIAALINEPVMALSMIGLILVMPTGVAGIFQRTVGDGAAIFTGILALLAGTIASYLVGPTLTKSDGSAILLVVLAIVLFGSALMMIFDEWWNPFYKV